MLTAFRLKRVIGETVSMDPDDTLATKTALHRLGYLRQPDYGLTPYPDRPMVDGVKAFQRAHGLKPDGGINRDVWEQEMTDAVWDYCIMTFGPLSKKMKDLESLQRASKRKGVRVPPE